MVDIYTCLRVVAVGVIAKIVTGFDTGLMAGLVIGVRDRVKNIDLH